MSAKASSCPGSQSRMMFVRFDIGLEPKPWPHSYAEDMSEVRTEESRLVATVLVEFATK
jgi:hypothetical protein